MPKKTIKYPHSVTEEERGGREARKPRSRERSREDLVQRLRSMLWFSSVDNRYSGNSTNAMDVDLLGLPDTSGRVMWRIKRHASDPGEQRSTLLQKRSPVEVIAERSGFHHTKAIYTSELFTEVLSARPLAAERRDTLIKTVLDRLGLYEPTRSDLYIAERTKTLVEGFRKPVHGLGTWLEVFARRRHIDHVLLLCLLYLRALGKTNLEEAIQFRNAIIVAIDRFCGRPGFSGDVRTLWHFIVARRVLTGRMSLDHSDGALTAADKFAWSYYKQTSTPAERRRREWMRYMTACRVELYEQETPLYITKRTPDIDAFLSKRADLQEQAIRSRRAESLWQLRRSMREGVSAETRFMEMHGHREDWRCGD